MASPTYPVAVVADEAPPRTKASNYPEPFAQMTGRRKQPLGDLFGLTNFGGESDAACSEGGVGAASRSHEARRARLHPAGASNPSH